MAVDGLFPQYKQIKELESKLKDLQQPNQLHKLLELLLTMNFVR
jgi:hypothetical protein